MATDDLTREQQAENARRWLREAAERAERAVWLDGGRRCAVRQSEAIDGWWVGESPRNGEGACVEGPWEDWVTLARNILAYDEKIRSGEATAGIAPDHGQGQ